MDAYAIETESGTYGPAHEYHTEESYFSTYA